MNMNPMPLQLVVFVVLTGVAMMTMAAPATDTAVDYCPKHGEEFDYIVVGAGSSGAVVANRLSESKTGRVLLLEAGKSPSKYVDIPLFTRKVINTELNWNYSSEKQRHCCLAYPDQVTHIPSGKGLGGTSNINSMIYTRGNKYDYDRLKKLGITGWSYEEVLPIFRQMETFQSIMREEDRKYHGTDGLQTVSTPMYKSPLAEAFLQAGAELNQSLVDCNAQHQKGFTSPPVNIRNGTRWGSYRSFLKPAMERNNNLRVFTESLVTKIVFEKTVNEKIKVVGVKYERKNQHCYVGVKREIIISAGALRSPQLLMLSGIGHRDELKKLGIEVVAHVPGVGKNLRDHVLATGIMFELDQPVGINYTTVDTPENEKLWEESHTGPLTSSNAVEGIAFFTSKKSNLIDLPDFPAIEISMYSDKGFDPKTLAAPFQQSFVLNDTKDLVTFIPILLQTKSYGSVTLRSKNAKDAPVIDPKYLTHKDDIQMLQEASELAESIGKTKAFKNYGAKQVEPGIIPGCENLTKANNAKEYWKCYLTRFSAASWHFTGTNKMGCKTDKMSVVDSQLRVHGVKGLRVADLSVMPMPISGHTHAVALLIGEQAAKFVLDDYDPLKCS